MDDDDGKTRAAVGATGHVVKKRIRVIGLEKRGVLGGLKAAVKKRLVPKTSRIRLNLPRESVADDDDDGDGESSGSYVGATDRDHRVVKKRIRVTGLKKSGALGGLRNALYGGLKKSWKSIGRLGRTIANTGRRGTATKNGATGRGKTKKPTDVAAGPVAGCSIAGISVAGSSFAAGGFSVLATADRFRPKSRRGHLEH